SLELAQRDIYEFSHKYLTYKVSLMNAGQEFPNRYVSIGDLVVADLVMKNTSEEVLTEILKISLLNEGWEPFFKRALRKLPMVVMSTQLLFPGVGQVVGTAYAIVSSLQSVKSMKKQKVDDAYIF